MTALTNEEVFSELYYSKKAILEVIGVTVQCWRPPCASIEVSLPFADKLTLIRQTGMLMTVFAGSHKRWECVRLCGKLNRLRCTFVDS